MTENIVTQKLRDFTVRIQRADNDAIVGTGIAVSTDGKVITCAHVVEAAGIDPRNANGAKIGVYFPQARGGEEKKRTATIEKYFPQHDDDIVLLQLSGGASPLAPEQIAILGLADESEGNLFRSYGFSPIGNYPASRAEGKILGSILAPTERNLQVDPVELESRQIDEGMSGSAVLDIERNLVVGLIAERFYSTTPVKDDISFGVDSKVLTFDPFNFDVRGEALELRPAPEFRLDKDLFKQAMDIANYMLAHRPSAEKYSWNSAPTVLAEWTGRDDLLAQITEDWNNPQKHVTGLIGFGGEGKSSLARKWVDNVCRGDALRRPYGPEGVFWWGFYENRSIDEFLEAALNFLSGGKIDPRAVPSSSLRAQIIGAMLGAGRYLFVLDGLEVLQHQEGDQYGLLTSNDLRDLLTYFARPDNQSFCLITSRAPLLDLMDYTTYTHRDVERLSEADGVALLERLQVKGSKLQLGKVVADWDGHALTISLLGSYLAEKYNGDIAHLADIPIPTADEPRYERVHRVLRRYDEHLTAAEREFLKLFSAFRTPVHESAFQKVFVPLLANLGATRPAQTESLFSKLFKRKKTTDGIDGSPLRDMVNRLVTYRILHCDTTAQTYTAHPLVRNHYLAILTHGDSTEQHDVHGKIKEYYLSIAGDTPPYPTLDDLKPLIEVVHHACQAGAYDEAWMIYWDRIGQGTKRVTIHQLGAYETETILVQEFFPNIDTSQLPSVTDKGNQRFLLNAVGFCLMNLGRLREAVPFYERAAKSYVEAEHWSGASIIYQNLAILHARLGALEASAEAARQALDLARKATDENEELVSLARLATVNYLQGQIQETGELFDSAEKIDSKINPLKKYLLRDYGIIYSDYLRRIQNYDYAKESLNANLRFSETSHWIAYQSGCHRVLGDLDSVTSNPESARAHYESALKIARSISARDVLIEALLARGRFFAKVAVGAGSPRPNDARLGSGDPTPTINDAFTDLTEALNYAVEGGYRIHEADIRVALAWAYLANGEKEKAKESAQRALQMSQEMGYHWGKVDAEEVMQRMNDE